MAKPSKNRVLKDRLWDDEGREWTSSIGEHLNTQGVEREARSWWNHARQHLHYDSATGEDTGPMPDDMGLSYSAEVWKRGDELLLAFTEHC